VATPPSAYALPPSRPLPPGVRPGPVFIPALPEAQALVALPADQGTPRRSTARQLCVLLRDRGARRMYAFVACGDVAVVSLPELNVWISPAELTWTYHGEPGTWPASDPAGAADHLARTACPAEAPARLMSPQREAIVHDDRRTAMCLMAALRPVQGWRCWLSGPPWSDLGY
jgi:hypothetical protein